MLVSDQARRTTMGGLAGLSAMASGTRESVQEAHVGGGDASKEPSVRFFQGKDRDEQWGGLRRRNRRFWEVCPVMSSFLHRYFRAWARDKLQAGRLARSSMHQTRGSVNVVSIRMWVS